jgi:hypothetical protein
MRVTFPAGPEVQADQASRTITGLVAPYGPRGHTNVGPLRFQRGSITWPEDLSRVKLMDYHQSPPVAVGFGVSLQVTDLGEVMTFQLGSTAAASLALQEAMDKTRDGLSVELAEYVTASDGETVTSSTGTGVALVPVPAFADARVTSVAAAHHQEGTSTMPETTTPPAAAAAEQATIAVTGPVVAPPAETPAEDAAEASNTSAVMAALAGAIRGDAAAANVLASLVGGQPARAPEGLGSGPTGRVSTASAAEVHAALARVVRGESRVHVEAALSDIVNTDVYEVVGQSSYVGQLWSALSYTRRFVPLLRPGTLTSWEVKGWKWGVKPAVADYAGDKADVTSNEPTVLPASTEAARLAGGHDLDIKFKHFGDTEFLAAYGQAMVESYAEKSDAKALAFIIASASAPAGNATASGGNVIDGAMLASDLLSDTLDQDVEPDYYLVNRADRRELMAMVNDDKPAFLDLFGVDPAKFIATKGLTAGTVIAGMKGAGTFYELPGSPIRVDAYDLARGGYDEAYFGYYATLLHDARGIVKVTLTA